MKKIITIISLLLLISCTYRPSIGDCLRIKNINSDFIVVDINGDYYEVVIVNGGPQVLSFEKNQFSELLKGTSCINTF